MRSGRCLCGECAYEIDGEPVIVAQCYCTDCQRVTGAGHSTGAMFSADNIRLSGPCATFELASDAGNTVTRTFCPNCGSTLFGQNGGMPGFMTVMLGTLDASDDLRPQVAIFTRTRRPWDMGDEGVTSFETQPGWKPQDGA